MVRDSGVARGALLFGGGQRAGPRARGRVARAFHLEIGPSFMSTLHIPYIIERSPRGERTYDIFSRLLMDRIVFLGSEVNDDVANILIAQLLFLEADAPGRAIQLYINSPG